MNLNPNRPLKSVRLVLVSPQTSGNLGAIARVAANFEVDDLRVVNPKCKLDSRDALILAKGPALDFLKAMKIETSLAAALTGCVAAIGFSRRGGGFRDSSVEIDSIKSLSSRDQKLALVFGPEDAGLSTDDLLLCTHTCQLSVGHTMPSLNLSHAVAVVLGLLHKALQAPPSFQDEESQDDSSLATHDELLAVVDHWEKALIDAGITKAGNPKRMLSHIRRILARAALTKQETKILRAYLSKTQVSMGARRNKRA